MATAHEIAAFWGAPAMKRWAPAVVQAARLSPSVTDYLVNVGLPTSKEWTLSFRFDTPWPNLPGLPGQSDLAVIGTDGPAPICINRTTGAVSVIEGDEALFLNSSIEALGEFLILYMRFLREVGFGSEDVVARNGTIDVVPDSKRDKGVLRRAKNRLREAMRSCDSPALSNRRNVWPMVLSS